MTLPTERDLPPARHATIRAGLVTAVHGRRERPTLRWAAPVLAAFAAVLIAIGAMALTGGGPTDRATPAATTRVGPPPAVPGISADRARAIERDCARTYADGPLAAPGERPQLTKDVRDLRLYQTAAGPDGTLGLLIGPNFAITCLLDKAGDTVRTPGGGSLPADTRGWLATEVSVDVEYGTGDLTGPGEKTVGGRVGPSVARLTVTRGSTTVDVTPVNGTFLTHLAWTVSASADTVVKAYDQDGNLIPDTDQDYTACYKNPAGRIIAEGNGQPASECRPAVRWQE